MKTKLTKKTAPLVGFIGGYLVDQGAITLTQLDEALRRQLEWGMQSRSMPLDQVLVEMGYVTPAQVEQAMKEQKADLGAKHPSKFSTAPQARAPRRTRRSLTKQMKKGKPKRR